MGTKSSDGWPLQLHTLPASVRMHVRKPTHDSVGQTKKHLPALPIAFTSLLVLQCIPLLLPASPLCPMRTMPSYHSVGPHSFVPLNVVRRAQTGRHGLAAACPLPGSPCVPRPLRWSRWVLLSHDICRTHGGLAGCGKGAWAGRRIPPAPAGEPSAPQVYKYTSPSPPTPGCQKHGGVTHRACMQCECSQAPFRRPSRHTPAQATNRTHWRISAQCRRDQSKANKLAALACTSLPHLHQAAKFIVDRFGIPTLVEDDEEESAQGGGLTLRQGIQEMRRRAQVGVCASV